MVAQTTQDLTDRIIYMNTNSSTSILLVDDDELNLKVLTRRLSQEGYILSMATSATAALAMMERQHFSLVLLDIDMPGMNGIELLKKIQSRPQRSKALVIMLSAISDPAIIKNCLEQGAADYLVKPFVMSLARSRIEQCLQKRGNPGDIPMLDSVHQGARILLVDDDELSRRLLTRQLTSRGYVILEESSAEKVMQRLVDSVVDLVLLDINMPVISGTRILNRIRNNPGTEHLPVIMVTADDSMNSKLACIESGADGYITKPVNLNLLIQSIASTLKARTMNTVNIDLD